LKIGLFLLPLNGSPEQLIAIGRGAEERGIDSIWVPEPHLLIFKTYSSIFPYSPDGKMPEEYGTDPRGELDGLLALAYLAAVTRRIRLGIGVCIVPQRNPVYTAKDVTTLDRLSNGRFDFGVGIGWLAEEFEAVGVGYAGRADRCRDYIEVMRSLWTEPLASYEGRFFSLPESWQDPKPLQQPYPPIHFGGNTSSALQRVADLGQGWIPWDLSPEQARQGIEELSELLAARSRTRTEIEVSIAMEVTDDQLDVDAYAEAGVNQLVIVPPEVARPEQVEGMLDDFVALVGERAQAL
jgi:probable F420-dependent oxidoreductase